jgi:NIPSNAP
LEIDKDTGGANKMIYELRTYTLKQGTVPDVAKAAGTVGREIRKDDYGKLEGYWQTEIGPLNQVMHLWSYQDLNHRAQLRAELGKNPRWAAEYVPLIRPNLLRQEIRLLNAVRGPTTPAQTPNVLRVPQLPRQARCRTAMATAFHQGVRGPREAFGMVHSTGGGDREKAEDQPDARQIAHAPEPTLWSADEEREPVPVSRDEEQPLPNARRKVTGSAEGE